MACPAMNDRLRALLASLLAVDTTSRASNLALIQFIDDYLTDRGVTTQWLHDDSGKKPICMRVWGRTARAGSCCRGTRTWCRLRTKLVRSAFRPDGA